MSKIANIRQGAGTRSCKASAIVPQGVTYIQEWLQRKPEFTLSETVAYWHRISDELCSTESDREIYNGLWHAAKEWDRHQSQPDLGRLLDELEFSSHEIPEHEHLIAFGYTAQLYAARIREHPLSASLAYCTALMARAYLLEHEDPCDDAYVVYATEQTGWALVQGYEEEFLE